MNALPDKNNDRLHQLIDVNLAEKPSPDFNAAIMQRLGIAPKAVKISYEPAISRNGWLFITFVAGLILYFALSGSGNNMQSLPVAHEIGKSVDTGLTALTSLFETSSMLVICMAIVSVFILTAAESYYRQSKLKTV